MTPLERMLNGIATGPRRAILLQGCPGRNAHYQPLPKWRRNANRPSCFDLITLLRKEMAENLGLLVPLGFQIQWEHLGLSATA